MIKERTLKEIMATGTSAEKLLAEECLRLQKTSEAEPEDPAAQCPICGKTGRVLLVPENEPHSQAICRQCIEKEENETNPDT